MQLIRSTKPVSCTRTLAAQRWCIRHYKLRAHLHLACIHLYRTVNVHECATYQVQQRDQITFCALA